MAGTLTAEYDRTSTPDTIALTLQQGGFGLPAFSYQFAGYPDRSGSFRYAVRNAAGDLVLIDASFDRSGQGRSTVQIQPATGPTASYQQCWGADACLVWLDDPWNVTRLCAAPPCSLGTQARCMSGP